MTSSQALPLSGNSQTGDELIVLTMRSNANVHQKHEIDVHGHLFRFSNVFKIYNDKIQNKILYNVTNKQTLHFSGGPYVFCLPTKAG